MSFQDFGKKGASRPTTSSINTASANSRVSGTAGDDYAVVSQAINQYQVRSLSICEFFE